MTGAMEPRPEWPVDELADTGPIQVPSLRLDQQAELEQLRAEVARHRAAEVRGGATRVDRFGGWERRREDAAQPLRTNATDSRLQAAADLIAAAKGLGVVGLLLVGAAALVVVLTFLYAFWRIALRFAGWAAGGNAAAAGVALVAVCVGIVVGGLWLFLRLTDRRRADR